MQIFLNYRNQGAIEANRRLSKYNFGLRKMYAIDEVLLEKRLELDSTMRDCKQNINTITDLEVYYDYQLLELRSIIEESGGVDQKYMKLIAKVLLIMNHYIWTSCGISKQSYRGKGEEIARIGQGNIKSGNVCRDKSYFAMKEVLKINCRAIIQAPVRTLAVKRSAVAFINNTAFVSNRAKCIQNM